MSEKKDRYDVILEAIECERAEEEAYYESIAKDKTIKEKITNTSDNTHNHDKHKQITIKRKTKHHHIT